MNDRDWQRLARYYAGDASPEDEAIIQQWLRTDPERTQIVESMGEVWALSGSLPFRHSGDARRAWQRVAAQIHGAAENPAVGASPLSISTSRHTVPKAEHRPRRRIGWRWFGGIAAGVAAIVASILLIPRHPTPEFRFGAGEFVTGPSETATMVLADGTVVRLAPDSRLRIPGVSGARDVVLEGRAYFAVAPMDDRPFRVLTRAGEAEVLGTRFEVRTQGEELRLVVLEGRVALGTGEQRVEVEAGEMSLISDGAATVPLKVDDVKPLVPWLERFLVFQSTPLREAARELEQEYGVRVEVTDSALAGSTITGWYADRTFEDVLTIVCGVLPAECSIQGGVARIQPMRRAP